MKQNSFVPVGCLIAQLFGTSLQASDPTAIISAITPTSVAGGVGSYAPALSADGRYVAFLSHAKNLTTNSSLTPHLDVFVHDLITSNTTLVSVNSSGFGSGDGDSAYPAFSPNGRFVTFASRAGNLAALDTNDTSDVFVQDLELGITELVSVGIEGTGAKGNANFVGLGGAVLSRTDLWLSINPSISADGRWVVFESAATNLVALADTNGATDIFIRDRQTGMTRLLSVDHSGNLAGNAWSELPSASSDARRVAFVSYATNLVADVTNNRGDTYVRDLDANTTVWASTNVALYFTNGAYRCYAPVLSANGEVVAFKATASNESSGLLFRFELATGLTMLLNANSPTAAAPSLSDNGRLLAYDDGTNVYVWDQQAGSNRLVSARFDGVGTGNGLSRSPVLSANGRTVAFVSAATDLVSDHTADTNALFQIYARDLLTGVIKLLTADGNGQPVRANHLLANIALSADGTRVAFDSLSGDLVPDDGNRESEVFVTDLESNETRLVSRRVESRPSVTGSRHVRIAPGSLSMDGRYLLFAGLAKASPPDDTVCCENLFIRDLVTGGEEQITDFDIVQAKEFVLSADGRRGAYITRGVVGDRVETVVHYDRDVGRRVLAHTDPRFGGVLSGPFGGLTMSPDGTRISYLNRFGGSASLYLFDSVTESNRLVSFHYQQPNSEVTGVSYGRFSPDGRRLVFGSGNDGLVNSLQRGLFIFDLMTNGNSVIPTGGAFGMATPGTFSIDSRYVVASHPQIFVYDLIEKTSQMVSSDNCRKASLSSNGNLVAFQEGSFTGGPYRIRVHNRETGVTRTVREISKVIAAAETLQISSDGRFLVISSHSDKLTANDTNSIVDVFAHDLITGATFLLSVNREGTSSGNAASSVPILGADGRTVIFQSFADDLVEGDYNYARDIFIAHLGGIDSDGDGMDDDWEMAYFESLTRNGGGDLDGDGTTDRQEFLAGTDPTNLGSALQVITVAPMSGGQCTVLWASAPGRTYRVQFKDDVDATGWADLPGTVTATGATASMLDATASLAHRFYRVVLVQ